MNDFRFDSNEPVYLVGGGSSLTDFDWSILENKQTIAINRAYEVLPTAKVLWWVDDRFWFVHKKGLQAHTAPYKATMIRSQTMADYPDEIVKFDRSGTTGFEHEFTKIRTGNNSGYSALCLAVKLEARDIYLLGYDFHLSISNTAHWHSGHTDEAGNTLKVKERTLKEKMLPYFKDLIYPLVDKKVQVWNVGQDSCLNHWPKISFEEAFPGLQCNAY